VDDIAELIGAEVEETAVALSARLHFPDSYPIRPICHPVLLLLLQPIPDFDASSSQSVRLW
jgi:hypothetical protein